MKQLPFFASCLCALAVSLTSAQTVQSPTSEGIADYEELPELRASEILKPEFLSGDFFKVREEVATASGANHYTIDSDFGVFEAEGNEMLVKRVNEINAIARLKEVSRTDEFKDALVKAAKSPLAAAKQLITDPVNTITSMPKGLMKFMGRIGETVKGAGEKHKGSDPEGNQLQQIIGFSSAKRKVAASLNVDPYSSNAVLQHELDGIAWASFAGGATFSIATMPIGGPAAAALTVTTVSGDLNRLVTEKNPTDLRTINRKSLLAMQVSEADAERFLNNNAFSPTAQTAFVLNLKSLDGVANREAFVRLAGRWSSTEPDANFCVLTSALLSKLHHGDHPLERLAAIGDFPISVAKDGTVVIALQWDYAAWTPAAGRFSATLQKFAREQSGNKKVLVAVSGQTSPQMRANAEALGHEVIDHLSPGPLKL